MLSTIDRIETNASTLEDDVEISDMQHNLTDTTVRILKESGGFRLLLAKDLGGEEAHPNEFVDWVISVGSHHASAGWFAGVVGVHPWEISFMDHKLQEEVYGSDPDTLTASPYAPLGNAVPMEGGFLLSGEWPYSTGTNHCQWAILGGRVTSEDADNMQPDIRHFVLPREDYEIVADSWKVLGLKGTGSFNVRVESVFVPDYRVSDSKKVSDGSYALERRPDNPLYAMMFGIIFPTAIAAGTLGIAKGFLREQRKYMETRISIVGSVAASEPGYLSALAIAEADLAASTSHIKTMVAELYEYVSDGHQISVEQRLDFRRNQVRATDRVFESAAPLLRLAGSAGVQESVSLERWWRDFQTGISHVCNIREAIYVPWGLHQFGHKIPPTTVY